MKAVIHTSYGPPEVAQIKEIDKPVPADNEVLVKVMASTVNRTDCGFRSAEYFVSRFWSGLFKPKYKTLGCEFAGVIEEIGKNVKNFAPGDKVFGYNDQKFGGHAEFLTIDSSESLTTMPQNITFQEAAPITEGSHYALNNIKASKIKSGQKAMVYGATGAIGSAALQLLKAMDVYVVAVCNTKNVALIKSLGADEVIDYQTSDFTKTEHKFHSVFDAVGKTSFKACKPILAPRGNYISTELGMNGQNIFYALTTPLFGGKKVLFPIPTMNTEVMEYLKNLVETGKFKPVIDRVYKLNDIVEAYKYVETGQKTGNVVIDLTY